MSFLFDLELDPLTLILKLKQDVVKMYLHAKNELPSYNGSKVIDQTDRQAQRH